ncbi:hypothetical protein cand_024910, partial [Cryptosporidium andersoni]
MKYILDKEAQTKCNISPMEYIKTNQTLAEVKWFIKSNGRAKKRLNMIIKSPCNAVLLYYNNVGQLRLLIQCIGFTKYIAHGYYIYDHGLFQCKYKENYGSILTKLYGYHHSNLKLDAYVGVEDQIGIFTYREVGNRHENSVKTFTACSGTLKLLRSGSITNKNEEIIGVKCDNTPKWVTIYQSAILQTTQNITLNTIPIYLDNIMKATKSMNIEVSPVNKYEVVSINDTFGGAIVNGPFIISMKQRDQFLMAELSVKYHGKTTFNSGYCYVDKPDFGLYTFQDSKTGYENKYPVPLPCPGFLIAKFEGSVDSGYTIAQIICNIKEVDITMPSFLTTILDWVPPNPQDNDCIVLIKGTINTKIAVASGASGRPVFNMVSLDTNVNVIAGEILGYFSCITANKIEKVVNLIATCTGNIDRTIYNKVNNKPQSSNHIIVKLACVEPLSKDTKIVYSEDDDSVSIDKSSIVQISQDISKCIEITTKGSMLYMKALGNLFIDILPHIRTSKKVYKKTEIGSLFCQKGTTYIKHKLISPAAGDIYKLKDNLEMCHLGEVIISIQVSSEQLIKQILATPHNSMKLGVAVPTNSSLPILLQLWPYAYLAWKNQDYSSLMPTDMKSLSEDPEWKDGEGLIYIPTIFEYEKPPSPSRLFVPKAYNHNYNFFIQEYKYNKHIYRRIGITSAGSVEMEKLEKCKVGQIIGNVRIKKKDYQYFNDQIECICSGTVKNILQHRLDTEKSVSVQAGQTFVEIKCNTKSNYWLYDPSSLLKYQDKYENINHQVVQIRDRGSPLYQLENNGEVSLYSKVQGNTHYNLKTSLNIQEGEKIGYFAFKIGPNSIAITDIHSPCNGIRTFPTLDISSLDISLKSLDGLKVTSIRCSSVILSKYISRETESLLYDAIRSYLAKDISGHEKYSAFCKIPTTVYVGNINLHNNSHKIIESSHSIPVNIGEKIIYITIIINGEVTQRVPVTSPCSGVLLNVQELLKKDGFRQDAGTLLFEIICDSLRIQNVGDLPSSPPPDPSNPNVIQNIERSGYCFITTTEKCVINFKNKGIIGYVVPGQNMGEAICVDSIGQNQVIPIIMECMGTNIVFLSMVVYGQTVLPGTNIMIIAKNTHPILEDSMPTHSPENILVTSVNSLNGIGYIWAGSSGVVTFTITEEKSSVLEGETIGQFSSQMSNIIVPVIPPCTGSVYIPYLSLINNTVLIPGTQIVEIFCGLPLPLYSFKYPSGPTSTQLTAPNRNPLITKKVIGAIEMTWTTYTGTIYYVLNWIVFTQIPISSGNKFATFNYVDDSGNKRNTPLIATCNGKIDEKTVNDVHGKILEAGSTIVALIKCVYIGINKNTEASSNIVSNGSSTKVPLLPPQFD